MKRAIVGLILLVASLAQAQYQNAELTVPGGQVGERDGYAISVSGNILASVSANDGAVYLFEAPAGAWKSAVYLAKLTASDGAMLWSVSAGNGGTVIVAGGPSWNSDQGAAYVFIQTAKGWVDATETARLSASDGVAGDWFGWSVSFNNKTIAVGASGANKVYVYQEPASGWSSGTETAVLMPSDGQPGDLFGNAVSLYGFKVAVGAPYAQGQSGAVYVFQEPVNGWTGKQNENAILTNAQGVAGDCLGSRVAEVAGTFVTNGCRSGTCGAFIYSEPTLLVSMSEPSAFLVISDKLNSPSSADSIAMAGDGSSIVLGDTQAFSSWWVRTGAAYQFVKPMNGWADQVGGMKLNTKAGNLTGESVAIFHRKAFVGAPWTTVGGNSDQGAVFVFSAK